MNLLHLAKIGGKAGEGIPNTYRRMRLLNYPDPVLEQTSAPFRTTWTFNLTVHVPAHSSELETRIIHALSEQGEASIRSLSEKLSVNVTTISLTLKKLCEEGVVESNGKKTRGKLFWLKK